jgi:hypothetical protein
MKTRPHLSLVIAGVLSLLSWLVTPGCHNAPPATSRPAEVSNLAR